MNATWLSVFLILSISVLLWGCGNNSTGGTVAEVSTLTIETFYGNGSVLPGARIFVNENFKGTTREYGAEIGTKTVVLPEEENSIRVEAVGFAPYFIDSIRSTEGIQHLTITLQERKSPYVVFVHDESGPVRDATVDLYQKGQLRRTGFSDSEGEVSFGKLVDGDYLLKVAASEHEATEVPVTIAYDSYREGQSTRISLASTPNIILEVLSEKVKLPEAEVTIYSVEGYNQPNPVPISMVYTDLEGKAAISGINYDTEYILIVRREGFNAVTLRRAFTAGDHTLQVFMNVAI